MGCIGHRLKNTDSQLFQTLNALGTKRRVILSGTPVQNDLDEFYAAVSFVNPSFMARRPFTVGTVGF